MRSPLPQGAVAMARTMKGFAGRIDVPVSVLLRIAVVFSACVPSEGFLPQFVEHPRMVVARPGATASFSCRARPVGAVLSWISDGTILINGSDMAFGKVFIDVASDSQAGSALLKLLDVADGPNVSFRCLASTPGLPGIVSSKAAMLVKARLRPFRKIEDTVVSVPVGSTASIRCSVPSSVPPASFVFERNGTTIDESSGRYHLLPNGELQIAQVQQADSGPYRCVAVNEVTMQKVEAANVVQLQLYDSTIGESPVSVKYAPRVSVIEGAPIVLPCVATGSPPPVLTWEKYGSDRLSIGYSRLWLGNLHILKAEERDAGTYLCRAENEHAKANPATEVTMLDVILLPRIVRYPVEQTAEEGASATFRCTLRRGVEQSTTIMWLHDGQPVGGAGSGILIENGTDGGNTSSTLTIGSVQMKHQGVYQCLANNSAGEETAYALLQVHEVPAWRKQSPSVDEPDLPAGGGSSPSVPSSASSSGIRLPGEDGLPRPVPAPNVTQTSASEVTVRWVLRSSDKIRSFSIDVQNQSTKWYTVSTGIPARTTRMTVGGLKQGIPYKFRVSAELNDGTVLPGVASSGFRLQYKPTGANMSLTTPAAAAASSRSPAAVTDGAPSVGISGGGPSSSSAAVGAVGQRGSSSTVPTKAAPADATIIMPPPKPTVKQIGETSVLVQWTQSYRGMPITFYRIQYKDTEAGRGRGRGTRWVTADHDVKAPATQYELTGLRPGGTYKFRLAAVYVNRDNRVSEATDRVQLSSSSGRVDPGGGRRLSPQLVPRLTHLLSQAPGQMFLSWEYLTDPAPIDGFVVQYMPVESQPRVWHESRVAGFNSRNWELRGLLPNTSYQVCVRSENAVGRSPCSNTLMRTTKAETAVANSFDEALDVLSQPNRGPSPAQPPNTALGAGGNGDGSVGDEDYQPATRGRTSQQPDELLYMVVGVVAGAMLLTLVVFVVACVRRQVVRKRYLSAGGGSIPGEEKDAAGRVVGPANRRSFNDASTLIFKDVLLQRARPPCEQQEFLVVPADTGVPVALADPKQRHSAPAEAARGRPACDADMSTATVDSGSKLALGVSVAYRYSPDSVNFRGSGNFKEPSLGAASGRRSRPESSSSLSERLSSYGCVDDGLPEARALARHSSTDSDSPESSSGCTADDADGSDRDTDPMACKQPLPPYTVITRSSTPTGNHPETSCEPVLLPHQRRQPSLSSLPVDVAPPSSAFFRVASGDRHKKERLFGGDDHEEEDVQGIRSRHHKCDTAGYREDLSYIVHDSSESRPFG